MKKTLWGAAAITLLITGCAQNELLDGGIATPNDGKIYFAPTSGSAKTRAAIGNPINSTADLQSIGVFHVEGFVDGTGAAYVNANPAFNGVSWEYADEPYWPNAPMDFYAYANWADAPSIDPTDGITATGVTVGADVLGAAGHKDLLVAATFGATKEVRTLITFKHALTQVVFKAGNINPSKIDVKIGAVEIVNVANTGDMVFSKAAPNIVWSNQQTPTTYAVQGIEQAANPTTINTPFTVSDLSATPNDYSKYPRIQVNAETDNNALMLIPQNFAAWDVNSGVKAGDNGQTGAYIKLTTLVTKKGLLANDPEADKYIYAGSVNGGAFEYGTVYIPVESAATQAGQWVAGKRVNYIITFGDSNSGSGGGGYDENGDPILVPIRFRATVEDWVETDVPLLTATFEATSSAITHKFIDGYTNQLLNDIKAAPAPKVYKAEIKLKGTLSAEIGNTVAPTSDFANSNITTNVTFQNLLGDAGTFQNAKFVPGSTLTFDFTGVTNLAQTNKAVIEVPTGWIGQGMNGATAHAALIAEGNTITLGETAGDNFTGVKLTKMPTTGYSYICQPGYLEDNLAAVELNENYTATPTAFANTITVKGVMPAAPNDLFFSSEMLAKIKDGTFNNSTLTINLNDVEIPATRSIQTIVPTGWTIAKTEDTNTTTYYPGDLVALTEATAGTTKTLLYTKQTGTPGQAGNWKNELELEYWLTQPKTPGVNSNFYYDNTDGLILIDLDATNLYPGSTKTWSDMVGDGVIYFRNPVGGVTINVSTGQGRWAWDNVSRTLNHFANGSQTAINIKYLSSAELKTQLLSATNGARYYVNADGPTSFYSEDWLVQGLAVGEEITVEFQGAAGSSLSLPNYWWSYTADSKEAGFKMPQFGDIGDISLLTAGQALYADATSDVDFNTVTTNVSLLTGEKIYVVLVGTGTALNPPAGWVLNGKVVTFTK